jgi:hypothetical protein
MCTAEDHMAQQHAPGIIGIVGEIVKTIVLAIESEDHVKHNARSENRCSKAEPT